MIMQVVYLPANQCYAVLCGQSVISIGPASQTLFSSKDELRATLKICGLKIGKQGVIETIVKTRRILE